jgi:glycosyltransferase involved in cell wall biosynthesis
VDDGRSGFLVDETVEALTRAMRACIEDPARRRRMGAEAARIADERFDAGRVAERFLAP